MYTARVDDKGRVKLPADFQEYFKGIGQTRFFITSRDKSIGQIYTISGWHEYEKFLAANRKNPRAARNVAFTAADLGGQADMDSQGRVLLPAELRRALGLEDQQVRIWAYRGRVEILGEKVYESRRTMADATADQDVADLDADEEMPEPGDFGPVPQVAPGGAARKDEDGLA